MDTSAWIDLAIDRICEKRPNSPAFELKNLFTGDEWDQLSRGEKTSFGREFANRVRSNDIKGIRFAPIGKNSRHNKYIVY